MYLLKCKVVSTKQMDLWEIFGRSGAVSNLSGSKAGMYSHYRRTILKETEQGSGPVGIIILHLMGRIARS